MGIPFVDLIECLDPDPQLVMWKWPVENGQIKTGAQLIVRENQIALTLAHGQASAVYGPGRHTLPSVNIPVLDQLKGWKYGFASPNIYGHAPIRRPEMGHPRPRHDARPQVRPGSRSSFRFVQRPHYRRRAVLP